MRKLSLSLTVLVTLVITSCTDDTGITSPIGTDSNIPIEIRNEINQVTVTRVNDEGFCNGDAVGVYVVNYDNDMPGILQNKGNQVDNVKYTYDEANGKWIPEYDVFYRDKVTSVDIIGYYPYATPSEVNTYAFEVAKDQSSDSANGELGGYEASDFLWGKADKVSPTAGRANIKFHHRMAGVLVELSEGTGFADGEWTSIEKEVLVSNVKRNAVINLATGVVEATGEVPNTATVPYKSETSYRAVVVPQTIAASTALFNITVDGASYIYRKNEAFTYASGKLHKFTIEVSKKSQSGLEFRLLGESITVWEDENITHDGYAREYVVIHVPKATGDWASCALKSALESAGKDYTKIKNLKVTGEIDAGDFYFMRDEMTVLQSLNLKDVEVVEKEIPNNAFSGGNVGMGKKTLMRIVFPENITRIGECAFQETNLLGSLILPNKITQIDGWAFSNVSTLSGTLTLSSELEEIGYAAFYNCSFSGALVLPQKLKFIRPMAFQGCDFSGNLNLPESLEVINESAFSQCQFTGSLTIPNKITQIPQFAFYECKFNGQLVLPNNLQVIDDRAFYNNNFCGELNLPEGLIVIRNGAFANNNFSGNLKLPQSLSHIGEEAFYECNRITGIIEFPQEMITISSRAFANCSQLEGIVLPKTIERINERAFQNCNQLNSIICKATTPPIVETQVFGGVAKDNFAVEVPEFSVSLYASAPEWNEFKRITAHRDFSISRRLFRTLNARDSKTLILRALSGEAWSIESKPDWVTVTPENGVGKTEVTITIDELARGNGNREGEVVFLLDGKDYRSSTKVEQYDYEYGDGDVVTYQSASKGKGVNLVFMGDCFDAKDIAEGKYLNGTTEAIEHFFAVEPYKSYRDYFNVYIVFGLSPDSGMGTVNTIREAKFGSQYKTFDVLGECIVPNETICYEYACKAATVTSQNISETVVVLVENTSEYGGVSYMRSDGFAIAVCPMSEDAYPYDFRGLVQHEAGGHGFGKLGDEYINFNLFFSKDSKDYEKFIIGQSLGWYQNLSLTGNMYDVPWSHLIFDEKYQNTVDIYEGGYKYTRGVFRSEPASCMNNNIPYFSAISREEIVKRIKRYAGEEYSFEEWKANDVALATNNSEQTRSLKTFSSYLSRGKQHEPVFMGDKPCFKSNK